MEHELPQRPRSHQLETESRLAFEALLPSRWIYRAKQQSDYGVDGEVEIVDEAGSVSGRIFYVQLKGTDTLEPKDVLTVTMAARTLRYLRSLDHPVLIVRYQAQTGEVYVRWLDHIDLPDLSGRQTARLGMLPEDRWNEGTAQTLSFEVDGFRSIKSSLLAVPVTLALVADGSTAVGFPTMSLISSFRKLAAKFPKLVKIESREGAKSHFIIRLEREQASVLIVGRSRFSVSRSKLANSRNDVTPIAKSLFMGVGLAFGACGLPDIAAQFISAFAAGAELAKDPDTSFYAALYMARAHRVHEALEIAETVIQTSNSIFSAELWMVPALGAKPLSPIERDYFTKLKALLIEQALKTGDRSLIGANHYNLANHLLFTVGSPRSAAHHYKLAARFDNDYLQRGYFWKELGKLMFDARHYKCAAHFYGRSVELGDEIDCRPFYADALMFSGEYGRALRAFENSAADAPDGSRTPWPLVRWALRGVTRVTGLETQRRDPRAALKLSSIPKDQAHGHEFLENQFMAALGHDALCGLAWFNYGVTLAKEFNVKRSVDSARESATCFGVAAVVQRNDLEAWRNAIAMAINAREDVLLVQLISAGYLIHGESIVEEILSSESYHDVSPTAKAAIFDILSQVIEPLQETGVRTTLRLYGGNAKSSA